MYDCQRDDYTDFSVNDYAPTIRPRPLCGNVIATAASPSEQPELIELVQFAGGLGYSANLHHDTVTLGDVSLGDALAINARFGATLVICADLRRNPPIRFDD
ncbi:hypothetical protein QU481_04075 [Crenobacter sp. SG2303]|uniref:Uncharacterized protein n=1 Tax=Crenobacter oryzisoli TaxID=3056844 RepID=A0ABT7XJW0_9NEIS|nr:MULTISPECIES: hypothetical protein [unclassified Crenobacter]MDN0074065.1 hypothetical protein [Crenobacter sp. SG2303]MDN0083992.1 hypothetical protein [Crenobacter sp. SG2305]